MRRLTYEGREYLFGYHTQENRPQDEPLASPIKCRTNDAWLGVGYYFWTEETMAHYWGADRKMQTGSYDVYTAYLNTEKCLNAVFNEEHYFFFQSKIDETIEYLKENGLSYKLQAVHRFLKEEIWPDAEVEGIIFDDIPRNSGEFRIYSQIHPFYYKKRIQVVLFDLKNVVRFALYLEAQTPQR